MTEFEMKYPVFTREGRRMLEARAQKLRETILPDLRTALKDPNRDPSVDAEFEKAVAEDAQLKYALSWASDTAKLPDDPQVVEIGELVSLQHERGHTERVMVVDPLEASVDEQRVAFDSPFAQAVIGRRIGEAVEVQGPNGIERYRIVASERVMA